MERKISLAVLGIVVIIAIVAMVFLFSVSKTGGTFWSAGGHMQMLPETACAMQGEGCVMAEIFQGRAPYEERSGIPHVWCACPSGLKDDPIRYALAPLVITATENFPYTAKRTIAGVREVAGYPTPVPVIETSEAYVETGRTGFGARYPGRIHSVMTSCEGLAKAEAINPLFTEPKTYKEAINSKLNLEDDCAYTYNLIGGKGYCCRYVRLGLR